MIAQTMPVQKCCQDQTKSFEENHDHRDIDEKGDTSTVNTTCIHIPLYLVRNVAMQL